MGEDDSALLRGPIQYDRVFTAVQSDILHAHDINVRFTQK